MCWRTDRGILIYMKYKRNAILPHSKVFLVTINPSEMFEMCNLCFNGLCLFGKKQMYIFLSEPFLKNGTLTKSPQKHL